MLCTQIAIKQMSNRILPNTIPALEMKRIQRTMLVMLRMLIVVLNTAVIMSLAMKNLARIKVKTTKKRKQHQNSQEVKSCRFQKPRTQTCTKPLVLQNQGMSILKPNTSRQQVPRLLKRLIGESQPKNFLQI